MKQLTAEDLWQPAHDDVWNNISPFILNTGKIDYDEVFMLGGRGSGKSTSISTWIWMALTNDHRKNAVVIRKVGSSIRKSCFKQMVKSLKKLKLEGFWDVNKTDLTITNKYTKQQVVFLGLDDEDKVRSITTDVGYFSILWAEEARQFVGMEEIRQARASILRGGFDDDDEADGEEEYEPQYLMFLSYNPPKSSMSWINKESRKKVNGRLYNESTYLTMPPQWLGEGFIRTAKNLLDSDPEAYEHQYLGKVTGTGGSYFTKVAFSTITDEDIAAFDYDNMGCDWGGKDPNVFERAYYDDDNDIIYCFQEVWQLGGNDGAIETPERYDDFAEDIKAALPKERLLDIIYCDAQGKAERNILLKHDLNVEVAPKQGANDRNHGYSWLRSKRIICDPNRCPKLAEEFRIFEAKELPNGEGWTDLPGTKNDHGLDALRYAFWQEILMEGNSAI